MIEEARFLLYMRGHTDIFVRGGQNMMTTFFCFTFFLIFDEGREDPITSKSGRLMTQY